MKKRPNLHQRIVLNILNRLSANLQADLLSDGTLASRYDIPIHRQQQLSEGIVLKQQTLFNAFESALRNNPAAPILTVKEEVLDAKISVDAEGTGVVEVGSARFRFNHIDLLTDKPERRVQALDRYLAERTLAKRDVTDLRSVAQRPDFSHNDFLHVLSSLDTSIESFGNQLRAKLEAGQISEADLLPDDARHWDHLCAPAGKSHTLSEFIDDELSSERTELLSQHPLKAISSISLSFSAPALVPIVMFRQLETDQVVTMLERLLDYDDHFAHVGAFEICAESIERDQRFVQLGERFLDRLFSDFSRLQAASEIFGTAFVIATAHLARHERLRRTPAFWRRLVAATHASLVVRVSGVVDATNKELLSWALSISGRPYVTSTLLAMYEQPSWRPEWIMPDFLIADAFGRANVACSKLPDNLIPSSWTSRIGAARSVLNERNLIGLTIIPAVNEGSRRPKQPGPAEVATFVGAFQALSKDPSTEHLIRLTYVIYSVGFPKEHLDSLSEVLRRIRNAPSSLSDPKNQAALTLCAHIAAQINNVPLADDVASTCLEGVRAIKQPERANDATLRIIECAAADSNRDAAYATLVRRLENIGSIIPSKLMPNFLDILEMLRDIEPRLALGRAVALAQLGMPRSEIS